MIYYRRTSCRICNNSQLRLILSLGPTPLANSFLRSPEDFNQEAYFPLDVYFCEKCSLVQLLDVIDSKVLFRNYIYVAGTSDTIAAHNSEYARTIVEVAGLTNKHLVVEVGSNDGSLLQCFHRVGVNTLGIEPATNIAEKAQANGIETINRFFNKSCARLVRESHGPAKVVIGNNVLAHVDDPRDFLGGCKELLDEEGLVVIEVPYLRNLLDRLEYDTIYHEHLCYFSASTLIRLCDEVELSIVRMDQVPVHGGSLRMYARPNREQRNHVNDVVALAVSERKAGLTELACYENFAKGVLRHCGVLVDMLTTLKREGKEVAAYGAPAKGNTLLNYCGIDSRLISYTVDKNPMKVGLYTPGVHIPVLPVSKLLEHQPDYVLILAWNYADEIIRQQQDYHNRGGRFIIPIPEPRRV